MPTKTSEGIAVHSVQVQEVILEGEDVAALAQFVRYRRLFQSLLDRGVFSTRAGSVTLHFDTQGTLRKIETTHSTEVRTEPEGNREGHSLSTGEALAPK